MKRYLRSTLPAVVLALIASGGAHAAGSGPPHLVTFFIDPSGVCPAGWAEVTKARGRLVMGTTDRQRAGRQWGAPLQPGQPQLHSHATTYQFLSPALREGKLTYHDGPAGMLFDEAWSRQPMRGISGESSLDLPYMQMLLCEKIDDTDDSAVLDTMPADTVAYFTGDACPARGSGFEWEPYAKSDGRFIVPLVAGGQRERAVGSPWINGPPPQHAHQEDVSFPVRDIGGDGQWCNILCGTTLWQQPMLYVRITGHSNGTPEPIPYVEMMVCRKSGARRKTVPKPPPLITFFRATDECADYFRAPASGGRFLVALPENGEPNRVFGNALKDGEDRLHTHTLPPLVARAQKVSVGSGNHPRHIGEQTDTHVALAPDGPHLPYIQLTQCWWKCPKCETQQEEMSHD